MKKLKYLNISMSHLNRIKIILRLYKSSNTTNKNNNFQTFNRNLHIYSQLQNLIFNNTKKNYNKKS
jgi:hypothetical protein